MTTMADQPPHQQYSTYRFRINHPKATLIRAFGIGHNDVLSLFPNKLRPRPLIRCAEFFRQIGDQAGNGAGGGGERDMF